MQFRTGSSCSWAGCVRVAFEGPIVEVVDGAGSAATFTRQEWSEFVKGVKAGEFDG